MSNQTPARRRRARNTKGKQPPAQVAPPKPKLNEGANEMAWKILFDEVTTHPKFELWCRVFKTNPEEFKASKPSFNRMKGIRSWCNRRLREDLIRKLQKMQASGEMDCYLRERGFRRPRQVIFDIWSDRDLVTAYRVVESQQVSNNPQVLRGMGISDDRNNGYRGKSHSDAKAKKSKPRNREDRAADARRNGDKPFVTIGPANPQGIGPVLRGSAVSGAGLSQKARSERAKKHPTRHGGGRK